MSEQKLLNEIIDVASRLYPTHNDLATRAYLDRIIDLARMAKEDNAAEVKAKQRGFHTFGGLALHRFATVGGTVKLLGKRERGTAPHQIYEIEVRRVTEFQPNRAKVFCDGRVIFSLESHVNFNRTEKMAVAALHRYLKELAKNCGGAGLSRQPSGADAGGGAGRAALPEEGGAA